MYWPFFISVIGYVLPELLTGLFNIPRSYEIARQTNTEIKFSFKYFVISEIRGKTYNYIESFSIKKMVTFLINFPRTTACCEPRPLLIFIPWLHVKWFFQCFKICLFLTDYFKTTECHQTTDISTNVRTDIRIFFISLFNQLDAQNLFHSKFYFMPLHVCISSLHRTYSVSPEQ